MTSSSTPGGRPIQLDRVLVDATTFLVERTRTELERETQAVDGHPEQLDRVRGLEEQLHTLQQLLASATATAHGPQVSRFWEAPGQEDG